jgi:hypothetical protein
VHHEQSDHVYPGQHAAHGYQSFAMRLVRLLLWPLILLSLPGCLHRAPERETGTNSVSRDMERIQSAHSELLVAVNVTRERLERFLEQKRKQSEVRPHAADEPVLAEMEILELAQDPQAPFRYRGRVRFQQPPAYRGREVDGFLLSHDRDLTTLTGQTITVPTHTRSLDQQLEPVGPFSIDGDPTLAADDHKGSFRHFDEARFSQPIAMTGRIVAFAADPHNQVGYFMFDILFSGDLATVEIESPELYRGTKLRVLVENNDPIDRSSWQQVGGKVTFSTAEATVAWEPWGFTRAAELKAVTFEPADGNEP